MAPETNGVLKPNKLPPHTGFGVATILAAGVVLTAIVFVATLVHPFVFVAVTR